VETHRISTCGCAACRMREQNEMCDAQAIISRLGWDWIWTWAMKPYWAMWE